MTGIRCMLMRGGTSKGAMFLAEDLPADPAARDDLLLRLLGSPDPRQIDGIGGGHPLTSKVAVVSTSERPGADVDYLFLQVQVDRALVSAGQPCGNILAAVGPFAVERGLVPATGKVRIHMANTGALAEATFAVADGLPRYDGDTMIDGVPFPAAPVRIVFEGTEGSVCGALLPTGHPLDTVDGIEVTCIDNGMPVVVLAAGDVGVTGHESPADLEANEKLRDRVERLRLAAGELMGLGDVTDQTVPKMTLVAAPREGGTLATRTFIPHRVHTSIGVLGAVTVATAIRLPESTAARLVAAAPPTTDSIRIEHPTGYFDTEAVGDRIAVLRTARKLFDGTAFPRMEVHHGQ